MHEIEIDYNDGEGIDFEPYQSFMSAEETAKWLHAWTGNNDAKADAYLIFGQDGTGGYAAIWNVDPAKGLLEQPIVFFGSEGELGVIAQDFSDYLWLLASGHGPYEAVEFADEGTAPNDEFAAFAAQHAKGPRRGVTEILAAAQAKCPGFVNDIRALCK
ncbi:MAG TPA: hypothetical protein VGN52_07560 [Burkholderiales bacterium]